MTILKNAIRFPIYVLAYIFGIITIQAVSQYIYYSNVSAHSKELQLAVEIAGSTLFFGLIYFMVYAIIQASKRNKTYKIITIVALLLWFILVPAITFGGYFGLGEWVGSTMDRQSISGLKGYFFLDSFFFGLLPCLALFGDFIYNKLNLKTDESSDIWLATRSK